MEDRQIELKSFDGKMGLLSGVWFVDEPLKSRWDGDDRNEHANCCYFMWQGQIHRAQENPDDGYRSSLGWFEIMPRLMPVHVWEPSEKCFVRLIEMYQPYDGASHTEKGDFLEFVSLITEKVVLTIGTRNTDDYYPSCVLHFDPMALSHNQGIVDLLGRENGSDH